MISNWFQGCHYRTTGNSGWKASSFQLPNHISRIHLPSKTGLMALMALMGCSSAAPNLSSFWSSSFNRESTSWSQSLWRAHMLTRLARWGGHGLMRWCKVCFERHWRRMKHHKYQKQAGDKQNPQGIHVSQQKPIKRRTWNPPGLFFLIFVLRHFCTLRRGRGGICCLRKVKALPFLQVLRRCGDDVSTPFLRSKDLCLSSSIPIHSYPFPSVFLQRFPFPRPPLQAAQQPVSLQPQPQPLLQLPLQPLVARITTATMGSFRKIDYQPYMMFLLQQNQHNMDSGSSMADRMCGNLNRKNMTAIQNCIWTQQANGASLAVGFTIQYASPSPDCVHGLLRCLLRSLLLFCFSLCILPVTKLLG